MEMAETRSGSSNFQLISTNPLKRYGADMVLVRANMVLTAIPHDPELPPIVLCNTPLGQSWNNLL
jgi:hypothetical protein